MSNKVNVSFELEQAIMVAWGITDDLQLLADNLTRNDHTVNTAELANALLGLKHLQQLKFDKIMDLFNQLHHEVCKS